MQTKTIHIDKLKPAKLKTKAVRYTTREEQKYYDIPPTPLIEMEDGTHLFLLSTRQGILGFKKEKKDVKDSVNVS